MSFTYTRMAWVAGIAALAASWVSLRDGGSTKLAAPVVSFAEADWAGLNTTVHGRLFTGIPFSRSCFHDASGTGGSFHTGNCAVVQENYVNRTHRRHDFGAYMNTEWETCQATSEQCLLDASNPGDPSASASPRVCSQGSVPPYYIDVETTEDIAAGFEFAEKTGVSLVVKNTGHDFFGRSSAPNSLALFMHNLDSLSLNNDFKPLGCSKCEGRPAVTMGAGTTFLQLYQFADSNNITIPGGADPVVGAAGGYLMGGGHSMLSNTYGLFVDRLLEVEVVVPTGQVLIANEYRNADLFFAIRGGGGGTFGVVTSITTVALPKMSLPVFFVMAQTLATDLANQTKWLNFMASRALDLSKTGWGGYIFPNLGMVYTNPLLDDAAATAEIQDILDYATKEFGAMIIHTVEPSYLSFYEVYIVPAVVPVGLPFATASRLLPIANFATEESRRELIDAVAPACNNVQLPIIFQVSPLYYAAQGNDLSKTSVTPAWGESLWHVTTSTFWSYNLTLGESAQIFKDLNTKMEAVRKVTPGGGAYFNEADVYEPNYQESFWGSNYDRLLAIKNKYDPKHILDCWRCVGFKGVKNPRYRCYIPEEMI